MASKAASKRVSAVLNIPLILVFWTPQLSLQCCPLSLYHHAQLITCIKLNKEYVAMQTSPPPYVFAAPDEKNVLICQYSRTFCTLIRTPVSDYLRIFVVMIARALYHRKRAKLYQSLPFRLLTSLAHVARTTRLSLCWRRVSRRSHLPVGISIQTARHQGMLVFFHFHFHCAIFESGSSSG